MSRLLPSGEWIFSLGDIISFDDPKKEIRLVGKVMQIYNSGDLYDVQVGSDRYEVDPIKDRVQPA